jgi:hypothetical protein
VAWVCVDCYLDTGVPAVDVVDPYVRSPRLTVVVLESDLFTCEAGQHAGCPKLDVAEEALRGAASLSVVP